MPKKQKLESGISSPAAGAADQVTTLPAPLAGNESQSTASQVSDRAPIDVAELFAEFPEISPEDRLKIENFESEQCENRSVHLPHIAIINC